MYFPASVSSLLQNILWAGVRMSADIQSSSAVCIAYVLKNGALPPQFTSVLASVSPFLFLPQTSSMASWVFPS